MRDPAGSHIPDRVPMRPSERMMRAILALYEPKAAGDCPVIEVCESVPSTRFIACEPCQGSSRRRDGLLGVPRSLPPRCAAACAALHILDLARSTPLKDCPKPKQWGADLRKWRQSDS